MRLRRCRYRDRAHDIGSAILSYGRAGDIPPRIVEILGGSHLINVTAVGATLEYNPYSEHCKKTQQRIGDAETDIAERAAKH